MPSTKRNVTVTKPAKAKAAKATVAKAATAARAAIASTPATKPEPAIAATPRPVRGVNRTASTIVAARTNYGSLSERDEAYLAFYAGIAKRGNGSVSIEALATSDSRPAYVGSSKPHDAGVIVRLTKAGLLTPSDDGKAFTFTKLAASHKAYASAK